MIVLVRQRRVEAEGGDLIGINVGVGKRGGRGLTSVRVGVLSSLKLGFGLFEEDG